jgi:hypothetical protein
VFEHQIDQLKAVKGDLGVAPLFERVLNDSADQFTDLNPTWTNCLKLIGSCQAQLSK